MKTKDLLSITDLNSNEISELIDNALDMKRYDTPQILSDKVFALIFEKPSLRTRVSFEVGIQQLGGSGLYLSPDEVGLGKRELISDVARVLSRYVDGIIARTFSHQTLQDLAQSAAVPVINALSDLEHPCQALADILTIYEKKNTFQGLRLAYIGDGNNVANSLLLAASLVGIDVVTASPPGYAITDRVLQKAKQAGILTGSSITLTEDPRQAAANADIIYTDVWTSMGQEAEAEQRRRAFTHFQVNTQLLASAKPDVIFMHPLPAHYGEEVSDGLVDNPASVVFDQAENRLHIQKAILAKLLS
jgi:ornithine carbamoyltransferase